MWRPLPPCIGGKNLAALSFHPYLTAYRVEGAYLGRFGSLMATGGSFLWLGDSSLLTRRTAVSTNIVTEVTCGTDARLPAGNALHKVR